jgi:hypothetical protein
MDDYSGHYEALRRNVRELYRTLLAKDYEHATTVAEQIIYEALIVSRWARQELEREGKALTQARELPAQRQ